MHYEKTLLDNGITVATERMESVRSVALGLVFRVGSRDELDGEAGISHFIEHMLFKGTPTRDARQLSEAFDALGASPNAFTSKESTCYYVNCIDEALPGAFELLADMVSHAKLDQADCESEREVIIEEIARGEDDAEDQSHELFMKALWPRHPLGLPIGGTRSSVGGFGSRAAKAYYAKHYRADNCFVVAVGNVDHADVVALAREHLQGLGRRRAGATTAKRKAAPKARQCRRFQHKDSEQAHLLYGTTTLSATDKRRFALALLNTAFGGTMSSRLFQEVREKRGLVYAVYSTPVLYQGRGAFAIYAGTRPENGKKVAQLLERECAKLAKSGLRASELERARQSTKGALALASESTSKRMLRLSDALLLGRNPLSFEQSLQRYDAVTLDEVRQLAAELGESPKALAVVGPYKDEQWKLG